MSEPTDAGIVQVRDVDPATLAVLRDRARSLGQSLSGYLRDLMDADAATETNAEVIARIACDREPVDLTMDDILAARDEGRRCPLTGKDTGPASLAGAAAPPARPRRPGRCIRPGRHIRPGRPPGCPRPGPGPAG